MGPVDSVVCDLGGRTALPDTLRAATGKGRDGCGKACLPAFLHHVVRDGVERRVGGRSLVALTGWGKGRLLGPRGSGGLEGMG